MSKKPDKRKGDRHRPGYWVEYGRKRRAREKALEKHLEGK